VLNGNTDNTGWWVLVVVNYVGSFEKEIVKEKVYVNYVWLC